jgi:hypothetical protein
MTDGESPPATADATPSETVREMRRAVRAVRREGQKAAVVVATVDAALALLATTLFFRVVAIEAVPTSLAVPGAVASLLAVVGERSVGTPTVHGAVYLGLGAGAVVFVADLARQLRKPLVVRFERANPSVAEALRTARDAVDDGADSTMARRLYADVLTRLRETSSLGLVDVRRLALALALVLGISVANVAVVAVDVQVAVDVGGGAGASGGPAPSSEYGGLEDPDSVLGDPTDVGTEGDDLNASIPTSGDGGSGNVSGAPSAYASGGFGGGATVESQQAGFTEQERLEDADLIREYNLRIRETDDDQ